ncbi:MAG: 3-dehydroquinate synthase [Thermoanaerobaculia bacterium]
MTSIRFGRGEVRNFSRAFEFPPGRGFLVSSRTVLALHGNSLLESGSFRPVVEIEIDDREEAKSLDTLRGVLDSALAAAARRDDFVVAFGGGVVTDLAGFAAAILLRGIEWYAIPTTLLGMADAAIGGKTAIDHPAGKNLIGSFHPPAGVVVDPDFLDTLEPRQFRSGLVEVYKAVLVGDAETARRMSGRLESIAGERAVGDFLAAAVRVKQEITARDLRDAGDRRHLNFGHTLGHALEAQGRFRRLTHGEAVAIGMAAAFLLSAGLAGFPRAEAERLAAELVTFAGAEAVSGIDPEDPVLWAAFSRDKKFTSRGPLAVLLARAGDPCLREVSTSEWKGALLRVLASPAL